MCTYRVRIDKLLTYNMGTLQRGAVEAGEFGEVWGFKEYLNVRLDTSKVARYRIRDFFAVV
jgi:hypothetical protein